jgi:hypothetical protein
MDDLSCLGCHKTFTTQRRLNGHTAQCDKLHSFKKNLGKSQRRLDRKKRRKIRDDEMRDESDVLMQGAEPTMDEIPDDDDMHWQVSL